MSYLYKIISTKFVSTNIDTLVAFKLSVVGLHFSKIRFYCLLLLSGINWILILKILMLRKKLLTFIRPLGNDTYGIYDPRGIRLLNRLRLAFSHLREHKFRH